MLQDNFKKFAPAKEMIQKGDFAIYDLATERDIDLTKHWETVFRPGQAVAMCMIFRRMETRKDFCPACENECSQPLRRGAQWYNMTQFGYLFSLFLIAPFLWGRGRAVFVSRTISLTDDS